jgi:O-antigen/teichoic acid export membrane protein
LVSLPLEYAPLVGLTLSGCALTILVTSFNQQVQFEKLAKLYVAVTLATALTVFLVSVTTVIFLGLGVKGMVIGQLAGNTVTFLAFLFIGLKATKPAASYAMARELLRQGLPLVPSFAFLFVLMHANKYILEWQAGLDAVGIYSIGFNFGMVISIVTGSIATAWYPFFMSYINRQKDARLIFGRIFTYYIFGVGLICLFIYLVAKPAVMLLTQEVFHDSYVVVGLVAMANFSHIAFNFFLPGIYFQKEIKYVSLVQGMAALISLPVNYYFIASLGVLGAGVGLAVNNLLLTCLMYAYNYFNRSRYLIITYEWGRVSSFAVLALFVVVSYEHLPVITVPSEIIKSISMSALLLFGMVFLLNKNERSFLIKIVRNK